MQAELERDLLIRPSPVDQGDGGLERLEIQKVERVLQTIEARSMRGLPSRSACSWILWALDR